LDFDLFPISSLVVRFDKRSQAMRPFTILILPALLCTSAPAQERRVGAEKPEDSGFSVDVQQLMQKILSAKHAYGSPGFVDGYRSFFKLAGPGGARDLQTYPQDGVAIRAAWEEVRLTVSEKEPASAVRPDRHKLDWFLGFLEGRARVKAPTWWSDALLDSQANSRDNIYPGHIKERLYQNLGLGSARGPNNTGLQRKDKKFALVVGGESTVIPEEILQKSDQGSVCGNISALMTPSRCYVAVHGNWGNPFKLTCIDRATGKILWTSEVYGSYWGSGGGRGEMFVAITEQGNRIVVFGSSIGMHVEAFRPEDGANLFRFATTY
jgi:hypothetical protein